MALAAEVRPSDLLLIQFTSGTTAYPKAVMLTHDNMLRNAWAVGQRMGIRPDDRYFNCRPFFHVAGTTLSLLVALIAGACLVTLPTFEAGAALGMMARERCTLTSGNDTLFQLLMGHPSFDPALLCLRGGWAAAGPETIRNIIEKMGARDVCVAYGLSEASPNVVLNDLSRSARPADRRTGEAARRRRGAHHAARHRRGAAGGRDRRDRGARLERHARLLQEPGRDGQGTSRPTAGCAPATSACSPPTAGCAWSAALKDVFRVGGENVAPAEVEEVLLAHPAVATAQVVGVPDARLGEVGAAFVTLKGDAPATESELIAFVQAALRQFPGAALSRDRRQLRRHRHDGERQGAEEPRCASMRFGEFKLDVARAEAGAAR